MKTCDVLLMGVGGQGLVTLGDLLARAAFASDVPVSFTPTKGMAQRGGFVKVEVRLGRADVGPRISWKGADVVLSMERSEALKGLAVIHPNGRYVLYDHVWAPTGVMLRNDTYPSQEDVLRSLRGACNDVICLDPAERPAFDGRPVTANIYALGALADLPQLKAVLDSRRLEQTVVERWPRMAEANGCAFRAGLDAARTAHLGSSPSGELLDGRGGK